MLARLLTPQQFGIYAVAFATQGILQGFAAFGVGGYITRAAEVTRDLLRQTFTVNVGLAVFLFIGVQIAALVSDRTGVDPEVGRVLRVLSLTPILGALEFIPLTLLGREMNFRALALIGVARVIVGTGTAVALAARGAGPISLAIGVVAGAVVSTVATNLARRRDLVLRPTRRGLWPIVQFGLQIMSIGGVSQLATRASDLILGRSLGLSALGLYTRASSISTMIWENVYGLVTGVMFSKMSLDLREKGEIRTVYLRSLALITGLLWPALIGMAVLARPMVRILYGDQWLAAALPLSILMVWQFVGIGFAMNAELFVLRHETGRQVRIEIWRSILGLALFSLGATFSIAAAALGRLAEVILGYFLYRPHIDRLSGAHPGEIARIYRESLLLTAVAASPAAVLMVATGWRAEQNLLLLAAAVLAGVAGWFLLLVRRNHVIIQEIAILRAFVTRLRMRA